MYTNDGLQKENKCILNPNLQYTLEKKQKSMWYFVVRRQFQLNKNWKINAEYGHTTGRDQVFCGLQYRFDL